ncbi:MAG: glycosyltransferase family 2 protein [Simkaniaceae bacterium]|nr:glycosyltransferase family 2 protein [Simkaniaceae bacterium]
MISAVILTKNNETTIKRTLESLGPIEIILVDNGSTDQTLKIAEKFSNIVIVKTPFTSFGALRNLGAQKASHPWILAIDSDEVLTAPLPRELTKGVVYSFPFHNFFNGKWIRYCGWYPDRHIRLYNKKETSFTENCLHEGLRSAGLIHEKLNTPIEHYSYRSISDFSQKMHLYSEIFADQHVGKKRSSFSKALLHGMWSFFKTYILKRGFLSGKEGWIISVYNGQTAYYKYLKLYFRNQACS